MKHNPFITGGLPAENITEEKKRFKLSIGDLQFFADKGEGDDDDDDAGDGTGDDDDDSDDDDDDDTPDLDELLKNPKFKAAHEAKFQKQLDRRLRKYKDVDPEEYRKLKAAADKAGNKDKDQGDDKDRETTEKLHKAELKVKRAAVKEFAVDESVDPILLSRFINMDEVELDEDGEPTNLEDLFDDLKESKYAKYFVASDDDDDDDEEPAKKKKSATKTYSAGVKKQKTNKQQKVDPKELGKQKALARHNKKGD